jgi:hypothetical protein
MFHNCSMTQAVRHYTIPTQLFACAVPAVNFTTQPGVIFSGYDVLDQADPCSASLTSIQQCAALCGAMPGCRAFIFKDPAVAAADECAGGCWLKSAAAAKLQGQLQSDSSMAVGTLRRTGV